MSVLVIILMTEHIYTFDSEFLNSLNNFKDLSQSRSEMQTQTTQYSSPGTGPGPIWQMVIFTGPFVNYDYRSYRLIF